MPNTPGGLPYPLPTEPVAQGAARLRALAEALDPAVVGVQQTGVWSCPSGGWQLVPMASSLITVGAGLAAAGSGVSVNRTGRFQIFARITFAASTAGNRRGVAVGGSGGVSAVSSPQLLIPPAPSGTQTVSVAGELGATAGDVLSLYAFQDTGANMALPLTASPAVLIVRRLPPSAAA